MCTTVKVWDPLVRLFHWSLLIAVAVAYSTQEQHYEEHILSGYIVLGVVLFRLLWGVAGGRYACFTGLCPTPAALWDYMKSMARLQAPRYLGHNPAGGAMVIALLLCLLVIALSGIALDAAENRAGPLAAARLFLYTDIISTIHDYATQFLLVLVGMHVFGVALTSLAHRENLPLAMVTGKKRR